MKALVGLLMVFGLAAPAMAQFQKQQFTKVFYVAHGGSTANSGLNPASPKPFGDLDLWNIPANVVIEKVYAIVDVAVAGTTDFDIGDDDDADGFLDGFWLADDWYCRNVWLERKGGWRVSSRSDCWCYRCRRHLCRAKCQVLLGHWQRAKA